MLSLTYIVFLDFIVGEMPEIGSRLFLCDESTVRTGSLLPSEILVVAEDDLIVLCYYNIHFKSIYSKIDGILHSLEGVGRSQTHAASMSLDIDYIFLTVLLA